MSLTPDEIRIADNYNREYPGMSRDQAVARAKQVLVDIASRGKVLLPAFSTKPVNHHLPARTRAESPQLDNVDAFRDGMMEALNSIGRTA